MPDRLAGAITYRDPVVKGLAIQQQTAVKFLDTDWWRNALATEAPAIASCQPLLPFRAAGARLELPCFQTLQVHGQRLRTLGAFNLVEHVTR